MTAMIARAAVGATVLPVINNIVYMVATVKTLTKSQAVKILIDDLDIEATVTTIALVCRRHPSGPVEFVCARKYVEKALVIVKFDLETIHIITKLHTEGWVSRWRYLNIDHEKKKLAQSMRLLRSRFGMMMSIMSNYNSVRVSRVPVLCSSKNATIEDKSRPPE